MKRAEVTYNELSLTVEVELWGDFHGHCTKNLNSLPELNDYLLHAQSRLTAQGYTVKLTEAKWWEGEA